MLMSNDNVNEIWLFSTKLTVLRLVESIKIGVGSLLFAPYCKLSMSSALQHYFVCVNKSNKET